MNTTTVFDGRLSIEQVEEGQTLAPKFDAQGLIACVTTEVHSGEVLMPGYMNAEAMQSAPIGDALAVVCIGRGAKVLEAINQPGVELAAWQREPDPAWAAWLKSLAPDTWPACRLTLTPEDATAALDASFDACGSPSCPAREAFVDDVARLVVLFAALTQAPQVRLRLERITGDACRRWHRDCVPLRLICTYRGLGTQWVPPVVSAEVLAQPDNDTPQAMAFQAADVALFKGCGWPGQPHDGGIVHRSPLIAGTGMARLVLVLDTARPSPKELRS
jgi:hypothetical protein